MKKIAIIGECMVEFSGTPLGAMQQYFGGDTLNTAVYLARLHQAHPEAVHYITAMGQDRLSCAIVECWRAEGVNICHVLSDPVRTAGAYLIECTAQGERSFVYWRDQSAAKYLVAHPEFPSVIKALERMDKIYLSGISLAILPDEDRQYLMAQLERLAAMGKSILFDTNHRPQLWEHQGGAEKAKEIYQRLLACTDLALLTDTDEKQLWEDASWQDTLARVQKTGARAVILKRGQEGCIYQHFSGTSVQYIPIDKPVTARDTTAAGDAFNAAFIYGLLHNQSPEHCARMGNALAGVVIQHQGALVDPAILKDVIARIQTDAYTHKPA